jgi:alkanesulfonate monooxygenase SsuD/methylene tetrahydromethanopterin reductase-like flavin-dependent oxidoreductase (luciferase family)
MFDPRERRPQTPCRLCVRPNEPVPRPATAARRPAAPTSSPRDRVCFAYALLRFGQGLRDLPLPSVEEAERYPYDADERALVDSIRTRGFVGGPDRVASALAELAVRTGVDELVVTTTVHDPAARAASYERLAAALP